MNTFFGNVVSTKPLPVLPQCGTCGLLKACKSPKLPVAGKGKAGILVVTDRPNKRQDEVGRYQGADVHLQTLKEELRRHRIDLFEDCWVVGAAACHTPLDKKAREAALHCRPLLLDRINELKPTAVLLLGWAPLRSVVGYLWKEDIGKEFQKWQGWQVPVRRWNCWLTPTFHPADLELIDHEVMRLRFRQDVAKIVDLARSGRPYDGDPPDLRDAVKIVNPVEGAGWIQGAFSVSADPVAFDFETNMLKPDHWQSSIACVSVSNGTTTVVTPWVGPVPEAFKAFLLSKTPKVASNMKFEDRWCRRILKIAPRNWHWDTMLAAHVLDPRDGISSIKFQSFVRLGMEQYDDKVGPFLKGDEDGGYSQNRVRHCDQTALMLYCGLDSLLEVLVADHQRKEMGL